jgi:hypothetical protein
MNRFPLRAAAFVFLSSLPCLAADLELRYGALERLISEQVFTDEGRKWVRGSAKTHCQYAYLEHPHIGSDGDRLRIQARFSGRSAFNLLGGCVGLGDSFDFILTALPVPRNGAITLQDVKVATTRETYYIRRVRTALEQNFGKDFKIEVKDQAKRLLEQPHPGSAYQQELSGFDLNAVRVRPDALVLEVEFKLVVK